jgi:hypothetical protein
MRGRAPLRRGRPAHLGTAQRAMDAPQLSETFGAEDSEVQGAAMDT